MKELNPIVKFESLQAESIAEFESLYSIKLPISYREFLLKYNLSESEERYFYKEDNDFLISFFYPLSERCPDNLRKTFDDLSAFLEKKYLAFAAGPGGGQFLLGLEEENFGKVFFSNMEDYLPEGLFFLAPDFSDFINKLEKKSRW